MDYRDLHRQGDCLGTPNCLYCRRDEQDERERTAFIKRLRERIAQLFAANIRLVRELSTVNGQLRIARQQAERDGNDIADLTNKITRHVEREVELRDEIARLEAHADRVETARFVAEAQLRGQYAKVNIYKKYGEATLARAVRAEREHIEALRALEVTKDSLRAEHAYVQWLQRAIFRILHGR